MSNRIFHIVMVLAVALFINVHDRPIVEDLGIYNKLVTKGYVKVTMFDEEADIFWQDFSPEERRVLQLMLRTP